MGKDHTCPEYSAWKNDKQGLNKKYSAYDSKKHHCWRPSKCSLWLQTHLCHHSFATFWSNSGSALLWESLLVLVWLNSCVQQVLPNKNYSAFSPTLFSRIWHCVTSGFSNPELKWPGRANVLNQHKTLRQPWHYNPRQERTALQLFQRWRERWGKCVQLRAFGG